jgi:hypothetical protein
MPADTENSLILPLHFSLTADYVRHGVDSILRMSRKAE